MARADKVHSTSTKRLIPHCQTSAILMSLQHGSGLLQNQRNWNGSTITKLNSQGYGKSKAAAWLFPAPWQASFFIWWVKAFPGCKADALTMKKEMVRKCVFDWGYTFYNLQWSRHPLHWTNHTRLNKNVTNFLKLSLSLSSSIIKQGQQN